MPKATEAKAVESPETPTVTTPEITQRMVTVNVDRKMTGGTGIIINGTKYLGKVTVREDLGDELMRIQEEHYETIQKLNDKTVSVRMKNDFQKESMFLAHDEDSMKKKGWSRDYGLLPIIEWNYCSPKFKEVLLQKRKEQYGY